MWAQIKPTFGVDDYCNALQRTAKLLETSGASALDPDSLDMAIRLVMAVTDALQQERSAAAEGKGRAAGGHPQILMPTQEGLLRSVEDSRALSMSFSLSVSPSPLRDVCDV